MYRTGQSPHNIVEQLGYDPDILGATRIQGISDHIKEQARSGEGFHEGRRSKPVESRYDSMTSSNVLRFLQIQRPIDSNKYPPAIAGGISFSGKTLNFTGGAQVRIL